MFPPSAPKSKWLKISSKRSSGLLLTAWVGEGLLEVLLTVETANGVYSSSLAAIGWAVGKAGDEVTVSPEVEVEVEAASTLRFAVGKFSIEEIVEVGVVDVEVEVESGLKGSAVGKFSFSFALLALTIKWSDQMIPSFLLTPSRAFPQWGFWALILLPLICKSWLPFLILSSSSLIDRCLWTILVDALSPFEMILSDRTASSISTRWDLVVKDFVWTLKAEVDGIEMSRRQVIRSKKERSLEVDADLRIVFDGTCFEDLEVEEVEGKSLTVETTA